MVGEGILCKRAIAYSIINTCHFRYRLRIAWAKESGAGARLAGLGWNLAMMSPPSQLRNL